MNLLEQPTEGSIVFDGIDIVSADERTKNRVRSEMGMVFQHFNLFPHLTILDNITLAPRLVRGQDRATAERTLAAFSTYVASIPSALTETISTAWVSPS